MKNTITFIVFVFVVVGFLLLVSGKRTLPPVIPTDGTHVVLHDAAVCMECHGPGKGAEIKKKHPTKYECFKCHKVKK